MAAGKKVVKGIIDKLGALPDNVVDAREVFVPPPLTSSEQNLVDWARTTFKEQTVDKSDNEVLGALTKIPVGSRGHATAMDNPFSEDFVKIAGENFSRKPSYFDDITTSINSSQLKGLEEASNTKFNTYNINEVLDQPSFPLSDLNKQNLKPEDQVRGASFIIFDPAKKKRYMVNTSGADSYIRNWSNLVYD